MRALDEALTAFYRQSVLTSPQYELAGLWPDMAPDNTPAPYITYTMPGATPDDATGQDNDDVAVAFHIRSEAISVRPIGLIFEAFIKTFDDAKIPISGYTTVRFDRIGGGRSKDVDGGWVWVVNYMWHIQKGA